MHFLLFFVASNIVAIKALSIVEVEQGKLSGTYYTLPIGKKVHAFLGIPYASPPIHENRFKEPQDPKPWKGVWNASISPTTCIQYPHIDYSVIGQEDCLYLSVFTPKLPRKKVGQLLDVMVYIHGGAFMFGMGTVFPDYIMKNDNIVYVTMNYRLNVFGFFSSGDDVVPGNNGLKDQAMALKWVQRNIINFGGNPSSITLSGVSAGGASVHYHFLSPMSDGLFHRGISLSGTTLPPWTLPKNNTEKSIRLASLLGCPTDNTKHTVQCLRERPAYQIVEMLKHFMTWRYCPFTAFGPVVEPPNDKAFLSEEPIVLLKNGKVKDLPWLTSMCKEEGLYPAAEIIAENKYMAELNDNWYKIAPHLLMYNFSVSTESEKDKVSEMIKKYYFKDKPISAETIKEIIQLCGDRFFYNDIVRAVKLHSAGIKQNVYCYKFSYRGKYSLSNAIARNTVDYGTSHADDFMYIGKQVGDVLETESDTAMMNVMTTMFENFIRTGDPKFNGVPWNHVSKNQNDHLHCLDIVSPVEFDMIHVDVTSNTNFWKGILPSEYSLESNKPSLLRTEF